jgi:SAM-dependent methyltransferase
MSDPTRDAVQHTWAIDDERFIAEMAEWLRLQGKDPAYISAPDLFPADQLHGGFLNATLGLLELADLPRGATTLDVGGGIGGPARLLAHMLDARVTVLDLTPEFCRIGATLTGWAGLSARVTHQQGNALALPFPNASFDVVWMQNVDMNIADKRQLFGGIARVLRPGGRLAFQSVLAGPTQPAHYPMPWADDASTSFLEPPEVIQALLLELGFVARAWVDAGARTRAPWHAEDDPRPVAPTPLRGGDVAALQVNSARNMAERRLVSIWAVYDRA